LESLQKVVHQPRYTKTFSNKKSEAEASLFSLPFAFTSFLNHVCRYGVAKHAYLHGELDWLRHPRRPGGLLAGRHGNSLHEVQLRLLALDFVAHLGDDFRRNRDGRFGQFYQDYILVNGLDVGWRG
jgi:hypothetical protein